jgi:hypothetical protein
VASSGEIAINKKNAQLYVAVSFGNRPQSEQRTDAARNEDHRHHSFGAATPNERKTGADGQEEPECRHMFHCDDDRHCGRYVNRRRPAYATACSVGVIGSRSSPDGPGGHSPTSPHAMVGRIFARVSTKA